MTGDGKPSTQTRGMHVAQINSTTFDAALKEYYSDEAVKDLSYEDNPFYAMVPKLTSLTGDLYVQPVQYGTSVGGRSMTFADALAGKDTNKYVKFQIDTVEDYAMISIGRKVMKQSANDRGAFFEARTREIDGMIKSLVRSLSTKLYRNSGGAIGQVNSSGGASATITLLEPEDICNFEVGMVLEASADDMADSGDALLVGSATVTGIDRDAGTLTTAGGNWSTQITGLTASTFLFAKGDASNSVSGLLAWIPETAPGGSDSFHGVNRSVDVSRLAGARVSASGDPVAEALRKGASRLGREGAFPNAVFMSHQKFRDLILELGNKVEYATTSVTANVGFTGVKIVGSKTPITVYADHNCPDKYAMMLAMDSWKLVSIGPTPDLQDDDGLRMLREGSSDGFEVRASYYANLVCSDPRANCVITLE